MAVVCDPGWKGTSSNGKWDNQESNLGEAEMIALGEAIIDLAEMKALPTSIRRCFKDLSAALTGGTVTITKGIHQRDDKVHFDVKISSGVAGTFHVFLKTGEEANVISPPVQPGWGISDTINGKTVTRSLFKYQISGLSYRASPGVDYLYPPLFVTLSELEKPIGRPRRSSFCQGNATAAVPRSEMATIT